jgi:NAD-dependent DNA ligase
MTWSFSLSRPEIVEILESHWAIFESAPTKVTNFMLVGEKPWSKAQKAEKLWITIYRTLDEITQVHPHIEFSWTKKDESNTPQMQSLFG